MVPFNYRIDSNTRPNYNYQILNQSTSIEVNNNITKGILKSMIAGTILLGISMTSNNTLCVNPILQKDSIIGLHYNFDGNNINIPAEISNDADIIKVTVIGNDEYEYIIENKSSIFNKEFLERIDMKEKRLQSQIMCSTKYYGDLPKNSINQVIENDERLQRKKAVYRKSIVSSAKYMGGLPKRPIV